MNRRLWEECIRFHGHECPGLAIGYRAVEVAMKELGIPVERAADEGLVCVAENDACGVDAVQWLTGCTAGKGNLIFHRRGKMAFSFFDRESGKGVRVVLKPPKDPQMPRDEFQRMLLGSDARDLFWVKETSIRMPEKAKRQETIVCEMCGEGAAESAIRIKEGRMVCLDCLEDAKDDCV